jgi:hypothetical protein
MNYAKISSTAGGKANQMYKGKQPLTEDKGAGSARKASPRTSSEKPPQMNMNGVSKCKP